MSLKMFAERYRLKVARDQCGDRIIKGKLGQIYEFGSAELGVMATAETVRRWNLAKKKLEAAGCKVIQNGDWEGTALFSPHNPEQARLAIRLIGTRQRKPLSAERLAVLRELAARARAAKSGTRVQQPLISVSEVRKKALSRPKFQRTGSKTLCG